MFKSVFLILFSSLMIYQIAFASNANNDKRIAVYQELQPNGSYMIMVKEMSRTPFTSKLKIDIANMNKTSSVGGSLFIACAMSKVAKQRGFKFFTKLRVVHYPASFMLVGFFNNKSQLSKFKQYKTAFTDKDIFKSNYFDNICVRMDPQRVQMKYIN